MLPFKISYRSSNLAIAKLFALILFASIFDEFCRLAHGSFLYCLPYSYCSSNYCHSNSCRSFTLLKALPKSNGNLIVKSEKEQATTFAIAIVGRAITLERKISKKKQRTDTKKDAKRIKSDNFTWSNREKSNIAIAILEKWMIGWHYNYFVFWW